MQLVVADAGPLIALAVAGVLPQALGTFDFYVPQAVQEECLADPYALGAFIILEPSRLGSFTLIADTAIRALDSAYAMGLGSGEVAVLSYALQHSRVALVDERRARRVALQLGVAVAGSGAVLLALKKSGAIPNIASICPALSAWAAHGYFLSAALQRQSLTVANEVT